MSKITVNLEDFDKEALFKQALKSPGYFLDSNCDETAAVGDALAEAFPMVKAAFTRYANNPSLTPPRRRRRITKNPKPTN
jgi:hypothetical protein